MELYIHIVLWRRSVLQAQTTLLQWFISGVADYQAVPPPPTIDQFYITILALIMIDIIMYYMSNIIPLFYYIDNININMYKHEYKLNRSLKTTQCVLLVGNNVISWNVFNAHQMIPDICTLSTLILKMPTNFQII